MYNVVIIINSVINKNQNHVCHQVLLKKCLYKEYANAIL